MRAIIIDSAERSVREADIDTAAAGNAALVWTVGGQPRIAAELPSGDELFIALSAESDDAFDIEAGEPMHGNGFIVGKAVGGGLTSAKVTVGEVAAHVTWLRRCGDHYHKVGG